MFVDEVAFGRSSEFAGFAGTGDAADGHMSGVAHEYCGFTGNVGCCGESFAIDGGDGILVGLIFRFRGYGPQGAVGEFGDDAELSGVTGGHGDSSGFDDEFCNGSAASGSSCMPSCIQRRSRRCQRPSAGILRPPPWGMAAVAFFRNRLFSGAAGENAAAAAFGKDGSMISGRVHSQKTLSLKPF
jgi:hypothetical protein